MVNQNGTPPAGARDAVTDDMVERACVSFLNDWSNFHQHEREQFRKVMRAALEAALTGKAGATQPAATGAGESETDRVRRMVGDPRRGVEVRTMEPNAAAPETTNSTEISSKLVVGNTAAPGMGELPELPDSVWTHERSTTHPLKKGTQFYTADQMHAYAKAALAAQPAPVVPAWVDALAEKWACCVAAEGIGGPILKQCAQEMLDAAYGRKGPPYSFVYGIGRKEAQPAPVVGGFDAWWKSFSVSAESPDTLDDRTFAEAAWSAALLSTRPAESVAQGGEELPDDATNLEVIEFFIRVGRTMKPVGHWPGERLYAAIERVLNTPRRFIAEADMSERRGHNGRGGDEEQAFRPFTPTPATGSGGEPLSARPGGEVSNG